MITGIIKKNSRKKTITGLVITGAVWHKVVAVSIGLAQFKCVRNGHMICSVSIMAFRRAFSSHMFVFCHYGPSAFANWQALALVMSIAFPIWP